MNVLSVFKHFSGGVLHANAGKIIKAIDIWKKDVILDFFFFLDVLCVLPRQYVY